MFITVNGIRLYVDVEGSALVPDGPHMRERPVLVLVHGGPGGDHSVYKPAWSGLTDVAQVIYYDHRGNGRSDFGRPEDWTLAQWADDLKALCDALGLVKPIIAGTSFGGFVAQAYATRYPGHPGKLILTSTAAHMDFETVFAAFARIGGPKAAAIARAYWTDPTPERRQQYWQSCVPLYQVTTPATDWLARISGPPDTALHFNGPKNEHGRMDFRADLARITCPVLLLGGEDDPITPIEFSEEIARHLPPDLVEYHRLGQCGHGVVADRPDVFDLIRHFITAA